MPQAIQITHWRRHSRLAVLRKLAEAASGLTLNRRLLDLLLEELHISDDFDVLVGRVAHLPASQYPRLLAIALLLRHSWRPDDLARTAKRLGLPNAVSRSEADPFPDSRRSALREHRGRARRSPPTAGPRTRSR
jgi:hypothetical protein